MESITQEEREKAIEWLKKFFVFFHHFNALIEQPLQVMEHIRENVPDVSCEIERALGSIPFIFVRSEDLKGPGLCAVSCIINSPTMYELAFVLIGLIFSADPRKIARGFLNAHKHFTEVLKIPVANVIPSTLDAIEKTCNKEKFDVEIHVDQVVHNYIFGILPEIDKPGSSALGEETLKDLEQKMLASKPSFFLNT